MRLRYCFAARVESITVDTNDKEFTMNDKYKGVAKTFMDSLINVASGLGLRKDKGAYSRFTRKNSGQHVKATWAELEAIYAECWAGAKVIDIIPEDMTREWRNTTCTNLSPEELKKFTDQEDVFSVCAKVEEALQWERLYGGSLIIPIFDNDNTPAHTPMDVSKITQGSLKAFNVVDAQYSYPAGAVTINPADPNYLLPERYQLSGSSGIIHHSRVIRFGGKKMPRQMAPEYKYWGQPILEVIYDALRNSETFSQAITSLMHEMSVDIISVDGLSNALAAGQKDVIQTRFEMYDFLKSVFNMVVIDSTEQFNNRQINLSGMDKIIEIIYDLLAGATDIPATRLIARSARGMNATGEGDQKNYYDMIASKQRKQLKPQLHRLDDILAMNLWGKIPEGLSFTFAPLFQESAKEMAERRKMEAEMHAIYVNLNIVTEDIVARQLQQEEVYDNLTDEYIKMLEGAVKEGFEENFGEDDKDKDDDEDDDDSSKAEAKKTDKPDKEDE